MNTAKLHLTPSLASRPTADKANRFLRHVVFWTILLLWITALAVTHKDLSDFNGLFLLNLVRLPLILILTYSTAYFLVPRFLLSGKLQAFILRFGAAFVLFSLLLKIYRVAVCGAKAVYWLLYAVRKQYTVECLPPLVVSWMRRIAKPYEPLLYKYVYKCVGQHH